MSWWNNLNLRWKLSLPIALIALLMIGETFEKFSSKQAFSQDFNIIYDKYFQASNLVLNADRDLYQAALAERTIALSTFQESIFQDYKENIEQLRNRLGEVTTLGLDERINQDIATFLNDIKQWELKASALLAQVKNSEITSKEATRTSTEELTVLFNAARSILDRIGENIHADSEQLRATINADSASSGTLSLLITTIVLLITAITMWLLPQSISQATSSVEAGISRVSNTNDLTSRIRVSSTDEIGSISKCFNLFLDTLQNLVKTITQSASVIHKYSSEVDDAAIENDKYSRDLSDSIKLISTSISQMSSAIDEVANNTEQVSSETNNADLEAKNVSQTFDDAIRVIGELCDDVDRSVHAIQSLKEQAVSIASVVDVIQGIAEQTNLLALNAAIEAARAGEQGRGFAVVADEVRSLASKTQDSTEDINKIIVSLQNGVSEVVHAMDVVKTNATSTVSTASHAKESLNGVVLSLSNINGRSIQVASAIEEQSATVNDIANNIDLIIKLSDNLSTRAARIADVGTQLKSESRSLDEKVGAFTV